MLECMIPLRAAEQITTPRRSAFVYLANGVHSLNYQITKPGKGYDFSQSLKPLEKYRQVITPVSGLHHPGSLGHHHNCIDIWLTGAKIGASERNTISVDQKMAEVTAQHTRYPSMEIAITQGSLAWTADGVQLPAMRRCAMSVSAVQPMHSSASDHAPKAASVIASRSGRHAIQVSDLGSLGAGRGGGYQHVASFCLDRLTAACVDWLVSCLQVAYDVARRLL